MLNELSGHRQGHEYPPRMAEYGLFSSYWHVGSGYKMAVAFLGCIAAAGSEALVEFVNGRKSLAKLYTVLTGS